jgi:adenylate kinase
MFVAITGTPGTGKSAVYELLKERGDAVMTVEDLARRYDALSEDDKGVTVDMDALVSRIGERGGEGFLVGHLAHLLPADLCIVLRTHPDLIIERLKARGYDEEKVMANAEAEAIDLILIEALDSCQCVCEIDCSERSEEGVVAAIDSILQGNKDEYAPGKVDWSEVVLSWY